MTKLLNYFSELLSALLYHFNLNAIKLVLLSSALLRIHPIKALIIDRPTFIRSLNLCAKPFFIGTELCIFFSALTLTFMCQIC